MTSWLTLILVMLLTIGSVALSVSTAPTDKAGTSGVPFSQPNGGAAPLTHSNLSSMLLDEGDLGVGVQSVSPVPAATGGANGEPPCLAKARHHTGLSRASDEVTFTSGEQLVEGLDAYSSTKTAHRVLEREVLILGGCHRFNTTVDGQTLSGSISPGLPHVQGHGSELKAYRFDISQGGGTVGLDLVLARKGVVDVEILLGPIADNSQVAGRITTKALAKIGAPVRVSLT